jgi:hypothetical protein
MRAATWSRATLPGAMDPELSMFSIVRLLIEMQLIWPQLRAQLLLVLSGKSRIRPLT